jgi:hypothetical protein
MPMRSENLSDINFHSLWSRRMSLPLAIALWILLLLGTQRGQITTPGRTVGLGRYMPLLRRAMRWFGRLLRPSSFQGIPSTCWSKPRALSFLVQRPCLYLPRPGCQQLSALGQFLSSSSPLTMLWMQPWTLQFDDGSRYTRNDRRPNEIVEYW